MPRDAARTPRLEAVRSFARGAAFRAAAQHGNPRCIPGHIEAWSATVNNFIRGWRSRMAIDFLHEAVSLAAGLAAGGINAVAAGGTLLTFPTLVWLGLNSVTANATSTVALWPFVVGGMFGYRRELRSIEKRFLYLAVPSLMGGLGGAYLLRLTPISVFDKLVPYLILFATFLFLAQEPIQRKFKASGTGHRSGGWFAAAIVFQFFVGLYGGYFGAGIGILMLAAFGILGMTDIHQMNGFKNMLGGAINGLAAIYFISQKMVYWPDVGVMAVGAIAGGYLGAGAARKIGRTAVRRIVVFVGFAMALSLFVKR
jgi:uncharacterized membrane protein YfcA